MRARVPKTRARACPFPPRPLRVLCMFRPAKRDVSVPGHIVNVRFGSGGPVTPSAPPFAHFTFSLSSGDLTRLFRAFITPEGFVLPDVYVPCSKPTTVASGEHLFSQELRDRTPSDGV